VIPAASVPGGCSKRLYRLALGQPNQEDFIDVLSRGGEATRALLQPLVLDLSAMGLRSTTMLTLEELDPSIQAQSLIQPQPKGSLLDEEVG
jgi:hypothetical protein